MLKKTHVITCTLSAVLLLLCGCGRKEHLFTGPTMGTTYNVKVVAGFFQSTAGLSEKITQRLIEINQSMSTYIPDSEISRFNRLAATGEKFAVSKDFMQVMLTAEKIFLLTDGAWDGTVNPLVDLWGFGSGKRRSKPPPPAEIAQRRRAVGFDAIGIVDDRYLVKRNPDVKLDLASIAKGYGVDQIAALLSQSGFHNFLVEIGGEVYAGGRRKDGRAWRVGINTPQSGAPADQVYKSVDLTDWALATSGDYRNFFEVGGRRYSHVIDPRSGYPVANGVVSASVLADNCTFADGLATALMVMGAEKGLALVDRLEGVAGLIVVQRADGRFMDHYSKAFPAAE